MPIFRHQLSPSSPSPSNCQSYQSLSRWQIWNNWETAEYSPLVRRKTDWINRAKWRWLMFASLTKEAMNWWPLQMHLKVAKRNIKRSSIHIYMYFNMLLFGRSIIGLNPIKNTTKWKISIRCKYYSLTYLCSSVFFSVLRRAYSFLMSTLYITFNVLLTFVKSKKTADSPSSIMQFIFWWIWETFLKFRKKFSADQTWNCDAIPGQQLPILERPSLNYLECCEISFPKIKKKAKILDDF